MKNIILLLLTIILFSGCIEQPVKEEGKINVLTSFYPLYEFTTNVGGDKVNVEVLIPSNVEPHEYELKPSDMVKIYEYDLFVYNGGGMEPWIHSILESNQEVNLLDASTGVELITSEHHHEEVEEHNEENEEHGEYDPHIWLSPKNAIKQTENIRDALIEINPENKEEYTQNAKNYIVKLEQLDKKIREEINSEKCKKHEIVITHETLGYFCKEYGCEQIPLSGLTHGAEISVKELTEIISEIEDKEIKVIFFEEQVSLKTAETIATELGIQIMSLNTIHGLSEEDKIAGKNYITLMEDNISKLKIALECE